MHDGHKVICVEGYIIVSLFRCLVISFRPSIHPSFQCSRRRCQLLKDRSFVYFSLWIQRMFVPIVLTHHRHPLYTPRNVNGLLRCFICWMNVYGYCFTLNLLYRLLTPVMMMDEGGRKDEWKGDTRFRCFKNKYPWSTPKYCLLFFVGDARRRVIL